MYCQPAECFLQGAHVLLARHPSRQDHQPAHQGHLRCRQKLGRLLSLLPAQLPTAFLHYRPCWRYDAFCTAIPGAHSAALLLPLPVLPGMLLQAVSQSNP